MLSTFDLNYYVTKGKIEDNIFLNIYFIDGVISY